MPGRVSLQAGEYYAHPRNLFWEFVARYVGLDREAPYHARAAGLRARGVALWDVLKSCTRTSSLDSDILESSVVVNEFGAFFDSHRHIQSVYFNGAKAEALFTRHVLPGLPTNRGLSYTRLPSTSPANASIPFATKAREWSRALGAV
jgi:TDG/mug DNA glycosylase family protein